MITRLKAAGRHSQSIVETGIDAVAEAIQR